MSAITMATPAGLEKLTEEQWQAQVVEAAGYHGWHATHFREMRGNPAGWPDLICLRGAEYRLLELKSMRGKLGPAQHAFIERAMPFGVEVHVLYSNEAGWHTLQTLLR